MKIEIKTNRVKNESMVREFIDQKVQFSLARLQTRISKVTVRLEDEGHHPKRFAGLCKIEVEIMPKGHIHVSSHGDSAYDCVLQSIHKMEYAIKHMIEKELASTRIRHQNATV